MTGDGHPKPGDIYWALTGAELEWQVEGQGSDGTWQLKVYEPSWREHAFRQAARNPGRRGRRPRPLYLTTEQLTNEKRWERAPD